MMRLVFKSSAENSAVVPFFCSHRCGTPLVPAAQIWLSAFDYNGAMSARTAGYLEAIEHLQKTQFWLYLACPGKNMRSFWVTSAPVREYTSATTREDSRS